MVDKKTENDLLRRARKLQEKADRFQQGDGMGSESGLITRIKNNAFYKSTAKTLKTIRKWLGPLGTVIVWLGRLLLKMFRFAAFKREKGEYIRNAKGERIFSFKRLSIVSGIYLLTLILIHATFSALYYYSTQFEEIVYVTGKQEIETGELYQFGGCTSLPCSTDTDNGKFYLIESSLYFPRLFYPEENVFANIPQQDAACKVYGYGIYFRTLRWLYKSAQLYQHVTRVSCRPYTEQEIQRAVSDGQILSGD